MTIAPKTRDQVQAEALDAVLRCRAAGAKSSFVQMSTGVGKAQPMEAKILTPSGWTTMGEIRPGDPIIASDGLTQEVVEVYERGSLEVFRVTFDDGSWTECCGDHLWYVRDRRKQINKAKIEKQWSVVPTDYLAENVIGRDGHKRWSIPMVGPVEFAGPPLPIDPYLMGLLLGDGGLSRGGVDFTNPEPEIQEAVRQLIPDGLTLSSHKEGLQFCISSGRTGGKPNPLRKAIDDLGLGGHLSVEKFVPDCYKFAPAADRVALVQGLLDTDGYVNPKNSVIEYSTSSPRLAEDFRFLVESLGGTATVATRYPKFTHKGESRIGALSFRITPKFPIGFLPFRLPRKAANFHPQGKYPVRRAIESIEPVGVKECRCIAVSAPDSLYVTDHCILTHNSRVGCMIAKEAVERGGRALILMSIGELVDQWADELRAADLSFVVEKADQRAREVMERLPTRRVCIGSVQSMQGGRLEEWDKSFFDTIVVDEAHLGLSPTFIKTQSYFDAYRVGLSATVDRLDGTPMSVMFERKAYTLSIVDAIRWGFRLPYVAVDCDYDMDVRGISTRGRELDAAEMDSFLLPHMEPLANSVRSKLAEFGVTRALAFLPDVGSADTFARVCSAVELPAFAVHGGNKKYKMSEREKLRVLDAHKAGEFPLLVASKMCGVGYNDPNLEAVIHLSPTSSRALFDQRSGRSGRVNGKKEVAYLFYFGWQSDLDLVGPTDIFAGDMDEATARLARKLLKEKPQADPEEVLERAKDLREEEVEREEREHQRKLKVLARRKEMRVGHRAFDPIRAAGVTAGSGHVRASSGVVACLESLGVPAAGSVPPAQAARAAAFWMDRAFLKMASAAQVARLVQFGVPEARAMAMGQAEAGAEIGRRLGEFKSRRS